MEETRDKSFFGGCTWDGGTQGVIVTLDHLVSVPPSPKRHSGQRSIPFLVDSIGTQSETNMSGRTERPMLTMQDISSVNHIQQRYGI